ncbi:MAG TPA: hypothetical protein VHY31_12005 [Streptosporangiaceae bacterium]|nr:hypothetical protein [Streptosporangiaceae bacterium]
MLWMNTWKPWRASGAANTNPDIPARPYGERISTAGSGRSPAAGRYRSPSRTTPSAIGTPRSRRSTYGRDVADRPSMRSTAVPTMRVNEFIGPPLPV